MKKPKKPTHYEITPARMVLPGAPTPDANVIAQAVPRDDDRCEMPETMPIVGVSTQPAQVNRAQREREELLREFRKRRDGGDRHAAVWLLDINSEFILLAEVREALGRLIETGGSRRPRGRPVGSDRVNPMVVVGLVEHLIATKAVGNRDKAFAKLEELGLMTHDSAKDSFYRALRERQFQAILLEFPELRQVISAEESARRLNAAEVLQPGSTITRRYEDPQLGTVKIIFKGEEPR